MMMRIVIIVAGGLVICMQMHTRMCMCVYIYMLVFCKVDAEQGRCFTILRLSG